jgi:hypothetical protein
MNSPSVVVAPNGALFVSDPGNAMDRFPGSIRRISAAKRPAFSSTTPEAERQVTTFQSGLSSPFALALHAPPVPPPSSGSAADAKADSDRDVGRLFVGCTDGVHAFDLTEGKRTRFEFDGNPFIRALAVTEDGARLFVVTSPAIHAVDTRTGASTTLITMVDGACFRAGPVTSDKRTTGRLEDVAGCVIDKATRSLVMCEYTANRIVRLRGVDV